MNQVPRGMDQLRELMQQHSDALNARMEAASAAGAAMVAGAEAAQAAALPVIVGEMHDGVARAIVTGAQEAAEVIRRHQNDSL